MALIVRIVSCHAICWTRSNSSKNQVSISCEIRIYEFLEDFQQLKTSSIFKDSELEVATVHRQNTKGKCKQCVSQLKLQHQGCKYYIFQLQCSVKFFSRQIQTYFTKKEALCFDGPSNLKICLRLDAPRLT